MSENCHSSVEIMVEGAKGPVEARVGNSSDVITEEGRDENDSNMRKAKPEERESSTSDRKEHPSKRSQTRPSPSRKNKLATQSHNSHPSPQRPYMHDSYPPSYHPGNRAPYPPPPHAMHGGPRGPPPSSGQYPPPPYYGGGPHDHYRGPPPPHYHQMPHLPHPGQYGHNGHYGHPPSMHGRPGPPPGYHPPPYGSAPYASAPPHMGGYHGGPPPHLQSYAPHMNPPHSLSVASDNHSISSSKSKGSHISRSTKSSHGGSKKRTIEGMHDSKDKTHAYSFRRTSSNASSSSTVTAGNNASEIHPLKQDSPRKRERSNHLSYPTSNNIFDEERFRHRRNPSGTSTASSLSGAFSLHSYDGPRSEPVINDIPMMKASPKRRKGCDSSSLVVDTGVEARAKGHCRVPSPTDSAIDGAESSRFEQLSMNDMQKNREENNGASLFMSLSTSPINHQEIDSTPLCKNTVKKGATKITIKTDIMEDDDAKETQGNLKPSPFRKPLHIRAADTPTPPGPEGMTDSEMMTEEHLLNRHLRGQTFTPLPHLADSGVSPSNAGFNSINHALSWSIAGDTPSLEDLATCSWEENEKGESKRPGSTTSHLSTSTREMVISPHNFSLWKEEHETNRKGEEGKDNDTVRLSLLSPHSEIGIGGEGECGTTTPLPLFFHDKCVSEERENVNHDKKSCSSKHGEPEHMHSMYMSGGARGSGMKQHYPNAHYGWKHDGHGAPPTPVFAGSKPPTPLYAGSNVGFARSPLHGDGRDHRMMFGHPPPHAHNDRVRNLRGRLPPGSHMPPMPLHIPPPMSSHHPLTSPMGLGQQHGKPMWSPHHSMAPPMASPHHMSPMDMSQSKRKCVPLKPPIPSKFQGDMDKVKGASVPEFTSLVNFPAHMSQKQSVNLPEGMRCCVMCGQACPCSNGNKKKPVPGKGKSDSSLAPRNSNGQEPGMMGDKNFAIIPTQNKGLCTLCDVNVWVVVNNGLEIKWCKGCKNFRPWAAFGDKGLATKCLRCRERQREKYALQKEEKDKVRSTKGAKIKG